MSRHTPGPWHVGGSGSASAKGADRVWGPDGAAVCAISTRRMLGANEAPEEVANAKLIASAPEQQAKIDALADALEDIIGVRDPAGHWQAIVERARVALTLAGRRPQ